MNATKLMTILFAASMSAGCIVHDHYDECWDCDVNNPPPPQYERISMFATEAYASSEGIPGSSDFGAVQATGEPDVIHCGDDPRAWSPQLAEITPGVQPDGNTIDEFLEVTFPEPVWVSQVKIYESYNPGAIVAVDLESSTGSAPVTVLWENFSGNGYGPCPSAFVINVNGTTAYRYDRVVIYLDTNLVGDANRNGTVSDDYNSIDAVLLSGDVPL